MAPRLRLLPRAAPSDRLRVWVGAAGFESAPELSWRLNGAPASPSVLRPLTSPRRFGPVGSPRTFTGTVEFRTGVRPDTYYRVEARSSGDGPAIGADLILRSLPLQLASGTTVRFNVLLVSCYYRHRDRNRRVGRLVARLPVQQQPHLALFLGDQVYLDLPLFSTDRLDAEGLERKFEQDYVENWFAADGYGSLLAAAPTVHLPDDHEFWNNFPEKVPWLPRTGPPHASVWEAAARRFLDAFQMPVPARPADAVRIDVPPVSFCCLDTRSRRSRGSGPASHPDALARFRTWAEDVARNRWHGVLVTGQALSDAPTFRRGADYSLADYADYRDLVAGLGRIRGAGGGVLMVTGDKHWGRVFRGGGGGGCGALAEIVVSPSSLVTGVPVLEQARQVIGFFRNLFGHEAWPRHRGPPGAPVTFPPKEDGARRPVPRGGCSAATLSDEPDGRGGLLHRGDQVAILSFARTGARSVDVEVTYYPLTTVNARPSDRLPRSVSFTLS